VGRFFPRAPRSRGRIVVAVSVVALSGAALTGCGSSARSLSNQAASGSFTRGVSAACRVYEKAITPFIKASISHTRDPSTFSDALEPAEMGFLVKVRALTPPTTTGVTQSEWRHAIDAERDGDRLTYQLAAELNAAIRYAEKHAPATPKLPPGTGPTAATFAQALNTPLGRHYLRDAQRLTPQIRADTRASKPVMQQSGVNRICDIEKLLSRLSH
jgi:hypothetical protein